MLNIVRAAEWKDREDARTAELHHHLFASGDVSDHDQGDGGEGAGRDDEHVHNKDAAYQHIQSTHPATHKRLVKSRAHASAKAEALQGVGQSSRAQVDENGRSAAMRDAEMAHDPEAFAAAAAAGAARASVRSTALARTHPATAQRLAQMRRKQAKEDTRGGGNSLGHNSKHLLGLSNTMAGHEHGMDGEEHRVATALPGMKELSAEEKQEERRLAQERAKARRIRKFKLDSAARVQARRWREEQASTLHELKHGRRKAFETACDVALGEITGQVDAEDTQEGMDVGAPSTCGVAMGVSELKLMLRVLKIDQGGPGAALKLQPGMGQAMLLSLDPDLKDLGVVMAAAFGRPLPRAQLSVLREQLLERITGPKNALKGCGSVQKFHQWQILDWSASDVARFLTRLNLPSETVQAAEDTGLTGEQLKDISETEMFEQLNLTASLPRQRLLYHLAVLRHMSRWNLRHGARLAAAMAAVDADREQQVGGKSKTGHRKKGKRAQQKKKPKRGSYDELMVMAQQGGPLRAPATIPGVSLVSDGSSGPAVATMGSGASSTKEGEGIHEGGESGDGDYNGKVEGNDENDGDDRDTRADVEATLEQLRAEMRAYREVRDGQLHDVLPSQLLDPDGCGRINVNDLRHKLRAAGIGTTLRPADLDHAVRRFFVNVRGDVNYMRLFDCEDDELKAQEQELVMQEQELLGAQAPRDSTSAHGGFAVTLPGAHNDGNSWTETFSSIGADTTVFAGDTAATSPGYTPKQAHTWVEGQSNIGNEERNLGVYRAAAVGVLQRIDAMLEAMESMLGPLALPAVAEMLPAHRDQLKEAQSTLQNYLEMGRDELDWELLSSELERMGHSLEDAEQAVVAAEEEAAQKRREEHLTQTQRQLESSLPSRRRDRSKAALSVTAAADNDLVASRVEASLRSHRPNPVDIKFKQPPRAHLSAASQLGVLPDPKFTGPRRGARHRGRAPAFSFGDREYIVARRHEEIATARRALRARKRLEATGVAEGEAPADYLLNGVGPSGTLPPRTDGAAVLESSLRARSNAQETKRPASASSARRQQTRARKTREKLDSTVAKLHKELDDAKLHARAQTRRIQLQNEELERLKRRKRLLSAGARRQQQAQTQRVGHPSLVVPHDSRRQSAPSAPPKDAAALGPWAAANGSLTRSLTQQSRRQSAWDVDQQQHRQQTPGAAADARQPRKLSAPNVPIGPQAADNTQRRVGSDVQQLRRQSTGGVNEESSRVRRPSTGTADSYRADARSDVQRARQELQEQQDALSSMGHFEKQARLQQLQFMLGKENQQALGINNSVNAVVTDEPKRPTGKENSCETRPHNTAHGHADGGVDKNESRMSESDLEPSDVVGCDTEQWLKRIVAQYGHG